VRDALMKSLFQLARKDTNVMLLTGDLGYGVFEEFERKYPKQYLNIGIAEQNMMGIAAGLALEGKIIFVYSIGNFPTLRCLEQIRNDACYHDLNINIIASGGGFSYGGLGMSHHATEDIAIMRALPGVTILVPSTSDESESAVMDLYKAKGVGYLRLDRSKFENAATVSNISVEKANILRKGSDITLIVSGGIAEEVVRAAEALSNSGIECRVVSLYSVKPIDVDVIKSACEETLGIITIEEGNLAGGIGSAILEVCFDNNYRPKEFYRFGLNDEYSAIVGSQGYLRSHYKIDCDSIVSKVKSLFDSRI